jgi:hypothetical protein
MAAFVIAANPSEQLHLLDDYRLVDLAACLCHGIDDLYTEAWLLT